MKTGVRDYWPPLSLVQHHFQQLGFMTDPHPGNEWNIVGALFAFNSVSRTNGMLADFFSLTGYLTRGGEKISDMTWG